MAKYLIDVGAGCFRPFWTNMDAVGFLAEYFDMHDKRSAEEQLVSGYEGSAGITPYPFVVDEWSFEGGKLRSLKYDEWFKEVSRCTAPDDALVVMFESAMTAVIRDGKINWLARLD